ncbi:ABC transporter substrate-binding protein [Labrys wisconsinensis]|uniref:Sorbitol/mannitol transport system substrate-binding protein n=1 Tax=Labrys wisconsinensis TaxID=425677 RepID=A0ABU0J720_9HYPH|nr:sugar ABC transporter substrate-binding protein [Labrys wisconsinensis]MDQ0469258.1 sorbitol/mannitol transport system substrate-binding protein [Labrys wisconsinensis]
MKTLLLSTMLALGAFAANATDITVATVNNPDMALMEKLSTEFTKAHPDITVKFVVLPDAVLRQNITQDVAVGGGRYDIVTVGPFEVQAGWVTNKWLAPLTPMFDSLPAEAKAKYDLDDLIPTIRGAMTVDDELYGLPFYGESSFTMYRKDLFEKAGIEMPDQPTWTQVAEAACKLNDPANGIYGIAMKGVPDYGQLAPFITFMHSYGAKWFDETWQPQINSPAFKKAFTAYTDLVKTCGAPGAPSIGFNEALTLMSQGKAAIWVDATVAAGFLADEKTSKVAGKIGYAEAPTEGSRNGSAWLYTWALAIVNSSKQKDASFEFIRWATSKDYVDLVARTEGALRIPPGTRTSTYSRADYVKAAPFAPVVLKAIQAADMKKPAKDPVPYTGTAQVNIPEYAAWAAEFGQNFSAVIAGSLTVDEALDRSQQAAERVMTDAGYIK